MPNLSENPHLNSLLQKGGLEINPSITLWVSLDPKFLASIKIGDIIQESTVVGFAVNGNNNLLVVLYNEAKEGQDDALSTINLSSCKKRRKKKKST